MISLFSIIKLTCKSALRSHIFQLLLATLIICVILLPNTISGDGTAYGYIQISLKYNLGVISFMLAMSTIWLSCFSMTRDMENYQLHMVATKPVSRLKIWFGKCIGIMLINFALLIISSIVVYGFIQYQFHGKKFPEKEKKKIENEVLVGRRVFYPVLLDINEMVNKEYARKVQLARTIGKMPKGPGVEGKIKQEIRKEIIASMGEIKYGPRLAHVWKYEGLPTDMKKGFPVYLRYRAYIGKVSSKDQRATYGMWGVRITTIDKNAETEKDAKVDKKEKVKYKEYWEPRTYLPEKIMCGTFNEIILNPAIISPDGEVVLSFSNFDPQKKTLFFQVADGPKLLIKVTSFFWNYCRAIMVVMMQLTLLAGLSCAVASFLSMPTAIFVVISYLLFGSFASFLAGSGIDTPGLGFGDYLGYYVSKFLLMVIIPMQSFEVSPLVANGELIEFSYIGAIFIKYLVCRGAPLFLLGIWLYWRRELGLVVKK